MAQAAAIVLADGQTTPANVTFTPEQVTPQLTTFVDRSTGVSARFRRLSLRYVPVTGNGKRTKTSLDASLPIWGVLPSGSNGVVYTLRGGSYFELPDGCTDAERKDLFAFIVNGLANTLLKGALRDNDPLY